MQAERVCAVRLRGDVWVDSPEIRDIGHQVTGHHHHHTFGTAPQIPAPCQRVLKQAIDQNVPAGQCSLLFQPTFASIFLQTLTVSYFQNNVLPNPSQHLCRPRNISPYCLHWELGDAYLSLNCDRTDFSLQGNLSCTLQCNALEIIDKIVLTKHQRA